jgi:multidrug efflux pump subunit AcrA (membrane-fusion protein)
MIRSLAIGAILCAALAGCARTDGEGESTADPVVEVRAVPVARRTFVPSVDAPGRWRSAGELVLSAPFAGVVQSVGVQVGDAVRAGQTLGTLVTRESQAALEGARILSESARDPAARSEAARALALARRDLVRVPLVAAHDGILLRRTAEPGAQVAEGDEILALAPRDGIVFEARVPPVAATKLRVGQAASVLETGALPRSGRIERILPVASAGDQAVVVWLVPLALAPLPRLESFGHAEIATGAPRESWAVPDSAVVEDDLTGERRVATVDAEGRAHWIVVTLGAADAGWHEVVAPPLSAGTRVIVDGQRGLPERTRVRAAP